MRRPASLYFRSTPLGRSGERNFHCVSDSVHRKNSTSGARLGDLFGAATLCRLGRDWRGKREHRRPHCDVAVDACHAVASVGAVRDRLPLFSVACTRIARNSAESCPLWRLRDSDSHGSDSWGGFSDWPSASCAYLNGSYRRYSVTKGERCLFFLTRPVPARPLHSFHGHGHFTHTRRLPAPDLRLSPAVSLLRALYTAAQSPRRNRPPRTPYHPSLPPTPLDMLQH